MLEHKRRGWAIHSDPTTSKAIEAVNTERLRMIRKSIALQRINRKMIPEKRQLYTGIYGRLLEESPAELEKLKEKGA